MPAPARPARRRPTVHHLEGPVPTYGRDVRVELAGHTVRLAELRARPERYARWFAEARRRPGHARCRCSDTGERLVIREIAGRFHVARWPSTADNHQPSCPFFAATESAHSGAAAHRDAITVTEHGTRIAVDYAFTAALPDDARDTDDGAAGETAGPPEEVADLVAGARPSTATVTGLGLLHWVYEAAALNAWHPGLCRRGWADVYPDLVMAVAGLQLGEHPAPSLCHVIAPYHPQRPDPAREARLATFLRPLEHPEHTVIRGGPRRGRTRLIRHRRLLLGELKDLTPTEHGHQLLLRHFPRPVFLTGEQRQHLTRRFPAAFSDRRGPSARRIVLGLIEGSPHGYLRLVDAAVMLVSADFLPADSSHEVVMADRLVAAHRAFTKPLRYGGQAVFPDFVLPDHPTAVVEVWGLTGREDYEARKRAKREHYVAENITVLDWTVSDPLPPIPPSTPLPGDT